MPMWRCPHCGTPQPETARCWVCQRSSTTCGTCRHFRRSVAAQLGYCGLDRTRQPLRGDEIRGCWEAWPPAGEVRVDVPPTTGPAREGQHREFVEVAATADLVATGIGQQDQPDTADIAGVTAAGDRPSAPVRPTPEPGWSLWGDLDR